MAEVAGEDDDDDEEHSDDEEEEDEAGTEREEGNEEQESIQESIPLTSTSSIPETKSMTHSIPTETLSLSNLDLSEIHNDSNSNSEDDDDEEDGSSDDDRESLTESVSHRRHRPSTRTAPPTAADVGAIVTEKLAKTKRRNEKRHGGKSNSAGILGKQKGSKLKSDARRAIKDNAQF